MILEEEIQRQEEQAMSYKSMGNLLSMNMSTEKQFRAMENYRLSDYHKQLAEWLKELKKYKEGIDQIKDLTDDYKGWDNWDIVKGLQYALECLEVKADDGDCD